MLTCWIYRRRISTCIDTAEPLPTRLERHLGQCPDCRRFYDDATLLAERLTLEASRDSVPPPPFLRGRILAALHEPPAYATGGSLRAAWPAVAAICCLLLAGAVYLRQQDRSAISEPPNNLTAQATPLPTGPLAPVAQQPNEDRFLTWSQKLDQPLEREVAFVIQDARSALNGLARNFLPNDPP